MVIAAMLTGQYGLMETAGAGWGKILRALAADFFMVKRVGYASVSLDVLAATTTAAFALSLAGGWFKRAAAWRLVGAWGLLTSVNVHLGLFQFTNYQREGWSLLLAAAALGGLVFDVLWRTLGQPERTEIPRRGPGRRCAGRAGAAARTFPGGGGGGIGRRPVSVVLGSGSRRCWRATCRDSSRGRATSCGPCIPMSCRTSPRWPRSGTGVFPARPPGAGTADFADHENPAAGPGGGKRTDIEKGRADNRRLEETIGGFEIRKMEYSRHLEVWMILPEP
jgi:hypothetical protein